MTKTVRVPSTAAHLSDRVIARLVAVSLSPEILAQILDSEAGSPYGAEGEKACTQKPVSLLGVLYLMWRHGVTLAEAADAVGCDRYMAANWLAVVESQGLAYALRDRPTYADLPTWSAELVKHYKASRPTARPMTDAELADWLGRQMQVTVSALQIARALAS